MGSFVFTYYMALAAQIARTWRRTGRCPVAALTAPASLRVGNWAHAAVAFLGPLPILLWSHCPACLAGLPVLRGLETWPVRLTGLFSLCAAGSIFWFALIQLGDHWRIGIDPAAAGDGFIQDGIYGVIRHPIYSALWLTLLGIFLLAPNLLFAVLWGLGSVGALHLARREEQHLLARHGKAYEEYMRFTGRFFPIRY